MTKKILIDRTLLSKTTTTWKMPYWSYGMLSSLTEVLIIVLLKTRPPDSKALKKPRKERLSELEVNWYKCSSRIDSVRKKSDFYFHKIGQYAALWPFLGICLEVIILSAIIFVTEKRRKRNSLYGSDADLSLEKLVLAILWWIAYIYLFHFFFVNRTIQNKESLE